MPDAHKETGNTRKLLHLIKSALHEKEERPGYFFKRVGKLRFHEISDATTAQAILKRPKDFFTPSFVVKAMRRFIGKSMILDEGESWKNIHQVVMPIFNTQGVGTQVAPIVMEECNKMVDRWLKEGKPVDAEQEMRGMTARVVMRSIFSDSMSEEQAKEVIDAASVTIESFRNPTLLTKVSRMAGKGVDFVWPLKKSYRDARQRVHNVLDSIIDERRRNPGEYTDLLARFLQATDYETGKPMTNEQIKHQMILFIVAGHETSAISMTFGLLEALQHPREIEKILKQVAEVTGGGPVLAEHAPRLTTCRNAFLEASRLHPAAYELARESRVNDVIEGVEFKKGDIIMINSRKIHKDPRHWDSPEAYMPDRFGDKPGRVQKMDAFLSFGGGPRVCTGAAFAMTEGTLGIANIFNRVSFRVLEEPAGEKPVFTMRLDGRLVLLPEKRMAA